MNIRIIVTRPVCPVHLIDRQAALLVTANVGAGA
ncbi:hypothetical protein TH47_01175 [Thalassospira sp. MCCC 1A02803]|nr:hypothetical protein TH47_01175 [Thalassospira sp. MCCC 1A02803]